MTRKRKRRHNTDDSSRDGIVDGARRSDDSIDTSGDQSDSGDSFAALPLPIRACFNVVIAALAFLIAMTVLQVASRVVIITLSDLADAGTMNVDDIIVMLSASLGGVGAGAMMLVPKAYNAMKRLLNSLLRLSQRLIKNRSKKPLSQKFTPKITWRDATKSKRDTIGNDTDDSSDDALSVCDDVKSVRQVR